jgi:hypothetical protein
MEVVPYGLALGVGMYFALHLAVAAIPRPLHE